MGSTGCPTEAELLDFLDGRLTGEPLSRVDAHLDACQACRAVVSEVAHALAKTGQDGRGEGGPVAAAFEPDRLVAGRYRVVRFLGRGGMGEVYEVEDGALHERVALKTVISVATDDARALERLKREVQLARKVTHPNVCRIFDVGFHEQVPFLTMELLTGETLWQRLRRGPMSAAEALPIVEQLAAALDAAHRAGVIHQDFKSDNVMLLPGRTVVTDFGLARAAIGPGGDQPRAGSGVVGTLNYAAPEQLAGGEVTERVDLYALGVVLFEMVTGALPFLWSTPRAALERPGQPKTPPLASLAPELAAAWGETIERCLARDPAARPATAGEVAARLRATPGRRAVGRIAAAFAVAALASGLAVAGWQRARSPASPSLRAVTVPPSPPPPQSPPPSRLEPARAIAAVGTLVLSIDADNARVELDGRVVASSARAVRLELEAERPHALVISAPGRRPFRRDVTAASGAVVEVAAHLPPRAVATGSPRAKAAGARRDGGARPAAPEDDDEAAIDPYGAVR